MIFFNYYDDKLNTTTLTIYRNMLQQDISNANLGQVSTLTFQPQIKILYYKNPILLNKQYNEDIIPGVYEGGFQLWQCEIQLLKKMFQSEEIKSIFPYKTVCEIGCGHGLLGIGAALLGSTQIVLQDYNTNVIEQLTKPTISLNKISNLHCQVSYLSGDWQDLRQQQQSKKYDIILASEVIYREQNYSKLIKFIKNNMRKDGKCIMANKSYYFGVGGSVAGFKQQLQAEGLKCKSLFKIMPKTGGNKKEIIQITF